jgi:transcriptional regulator, abrB family
MKATGVVRRIDELGRIVIPKEIRKNFRIKEGENVEIYIDDNNIILKKYSELKNVSDISSNIIDSVFSVINKDIIITDMSNIMELSSSLKNVFFNKELSVEYQNMLSKREKIIQKSSKNLCITDQIVDYSYIVNPMIVNGDLIGSIVLLSKDTITNNDIIVVDIITKILTKYIEE